jgi:hypothetical protein
MDRYSATRLILCIGVLAIMAGPAGSQVQVGELMVTPASDGVTVTLAREQPGQLTQDSAAQPPQAPGQLTQDSPAQPPQAPGQLAPESPAQQAGLPAPLAQDGAPPPETRAVPRVTRITVGPDDLPSAARTRPLPPVPAPRKHELERDVLTLKAARAAMLLDDQMRDRKMASLR